MDEPLFGQLEDRGAWFRMPGRAATQTECRGPRTGALRADGTESVVLLIDRDGCHEFDVLHRALTRLGVPSVRLGESDLGAFDVEVRPAEGEVVLAGRRVRPVVSWLRHLGPRSVAAPAASGTTARELFRADSWYALVREAAGLAPHRLPGACPGRLEQLRAAAGAGFAVPPTVVTTDPARAARAFGPDRVVVKALDEHAVEVAPGALAFAHPEVAGQERAARWRGGAVPFVVQPFVRHDEEWRVHWFDGEVAAFRLPPGAALASRTGATCPVPVREAVPLPQAVRRSTAALAARLGLRCGALDLLVTGSTYTFLEVNADGDWRWFERRTGTAPASLAALTLLRRLHADATGGHARRTDLLGLLRAVRV
ncbi:ATP-grasp domain-containing protein [Streptomyces sp. NRRL F-5123]|uniref:ATP-grasp domain-containing protein n=1 Tax=Streptomyces sp. NRRL F-5123 TaxID=1463856 RepID=UPI00069403EE|nr:hypothetical protein [Streptomyces sp. NRRL F-5123]